MKLSIDDRQDLRGQIVLALETKYPGNCPESTIKRTLFRLQSMPPDEELVKELAWLRDRGYLATDSLTQGGRTIFVHRLTGQGHELAIGEIRDDHVWVTGFED